MAQIIGSITFFSMIIIAGVGIVATSPFLGTIFSTIFLFMNEQKTYVKVLSIKVHKITIINFIILNALFTTGMYIIKNNYDFDDYIFSSETLQYKYFVYCLFLLGYIALIILNTTKRKFKIIINILLMSFVVVLNILTIFFAIKINGYDDSLYMIYSVPYNCVIVTIILFRKTKFKKLDI